MLSLSWVYQKIDTRSLQKQLKQSSYDHVCHGWH